MKDLGTTPGSFFLYKSFLNWKKTFRFNCYETIFVMSPIYWGPHAPEMEAALEGLDFTGKRIRIVSTHEGSGLASMPSDVKKMCKGADVDMKGLAIVGSQVCQQKVGFA